MNRKWLGCYVWRLLSKIFLSNVVKEDLLFLASFLCQRVSDMRGSRHQNSIWIGPISENVSLRVISVVAKFHAFIINLNNSVFFWSITAGLNGGTETSKTTKKLSGHCNQLHSKARVCNSHISEVLTVGKLNWIKLGWFVKHDIVVAVYCPTRIQQIRDQKNDWVKFKYCYGGLWWHNMGLSTAICFFTP